jgi:hypothetical protein
MVKEILERNVPIEEGGKRHNVTAHQALYLRIFSLALKGDFKAIKFLLDRAAELPQPTAQTPIAPDMSAENAAKIYLEMVRRVG